MTTFGMQERAVSRLDDIYRYTASEWGAEQAERSINDLTDPVR